MEVKARKDAERLTAEKSLELNNSIQNLQEMDKMRKASESIATELRNFIETVNVPVFGIDNEGHVNEWNHDSEKLFGLNSGEILGNSLAQYINKEYREDVQEIVDNALHGKNTINYELPVFTKDGQRLVILLSLNTRFNANGRITGALGVGRDVTDRVLQNKEKGKRADELIIAKEEKGKRADELIIANEEKGKRADELIIAKEEKGKRADELIIANEEKGKRADELIIANEEKGKRADELIIAKEEKGKRADKLIIANKEKHKRANKLIIANEEKEKRADELIIANKEKEKRADELIIANEEKEKRADELIIANEEKGKRADELIIANEEKEKRADRYRSEIEHIAQDLTILIDTANAPIFGIDSKGFVNEWNQASEKITGFTKEDVLGKDLVQTYITKDYRKSVKKVLDDALLGKESANYEFPLFTKDGERVMVLLNSSTRRDANGKITGVLGVGQDITELVGYRNKLEMRVNERTLKLNKALKKEKELSELKSKFVSTASHEFRTPLSAINFAAGSIKKYWTKMEPVMIEKKLHKIEDQVMHMTKLLDDILIVGQAESGKIRYTPVSINLGVFMNEIIEEVYSSQKKSHKIELIDHEELKNSNFFIDEKLGRNIFINIIGNAIKFSPDAKKVTIEFSTEKEYILISITDYGIGIPKSEIKNVFQPFTRGKNVDLIQGTGLGLSIAKEAIDIIGGEIIINSTTRIGTSFIVKIPKK